MTADLIRHYTSLANFLGQMLGPDYEITLHDFGRNQSSIIAITNAHISGRKVGAPLTSLAIQLISEKAYEKTDWKMNSRGVAANGKILRCSTFFIKDEHNKLVGLLCINFDDSRYRELSEKVFYLCHPNEYAVNTISINNAPLSPDFFGNSDQENLYGSTTSAIEAAFQYVLNPNGPPADRLNQAERLEVIQLLDQKGIFSLKGSITVVAEKLSCSQASIYRYLSKIHRENSNKNGKK